MRKLFFLILLILLLAFIAAWYSMQSLPSWADSNKTQTQITSKQLSDKISNQGITQFLGSKAKDILKGEVSLDDIEFNAILLASLKANTDGRKLLSVSDDFRAFIKEDKVQITVIINLDKLEKVEPNARKAVEKIDRLFPFLKKSRMALTIYVTPIARRGKLAVKDDFHIKVGAIPISNDSLRALGAKVEQANDKELAVKYVSIKSLRLTSGEITLRVDPRL